MKKYFFIATLVLLLLFQVSIVNAELQNSSGTSADEWFDKGYSLMDQGKYADALNCFDKALELNPSDYLALYNKGLCYYELGKPMSELESYEKCLKINPDYGDAWFNKGIVLYELGRYEESLACFDKVLELEPGAQDATKMRQKVLDAMR